MTTAAKLIDRLCEAKPKKSGKSGVVSSGSLTWEPAPKKYLESGRTVKVAKGKRGTWIASAASNDSVHLSLATPRGKDGEGTHDSWNKAYKAAEKKDAK